MTAALEADVMVVGAGPAGSSLAGRLARRGASVILLERARFPRDKTCGEFLSPESLALLDEAGVLPALRAAGAPDVRCFRFTAPGARPLERALPGGPGLAVSRRTLDEALARAAQAQGARLVEGARATGVQVLGPTRLQVEWLTTTGGGRARAAAVMDATGRADGLLARAPESPEATRRREHLEDAARELEEATSTRPRGSVRPGDGPLVAFKRHYEGGGGRLGGAVEIHVFPGGYCGLVQVERDLVNACFVAPTSAFRASGSRAGPLLDSALAASPRLAERLEGLVPHEDSFLSTTRVPSLSRPHHPGGGPAAPVGDAAAAIAPLCGDGMAMALRSAAIAEPVLADYLGGGTAWRTAQERLAAEIARAFRTRRALGSLLHAALVRPGTARLCLTLARLAPPVADALARHTRG